MVQYSVELRTEVPSIHRVDLVRIWNDENAVWADVKVFNNDPAKSYDLILSGDNYVRLICTFNGAVDLEYTFQVLPHEANLELKLSERN